MITFEFLTEFLATQPENRFSYLTRVSTLADVFFLGPSIWVITFSTENALDYTISRDAFLLQLAWLRFLRFYGAEHDFARLLPGASEVNIQITALCLDLFALVCTFAGGTYFFEAYADEPGGYTTFFDFFYFAIVTLSTVGYGDFSPGLRIARAFVILFICLIFSLIPTKVAKLADLMASRPTLVGRMPALKRMAQWNLPPGACPENELILVRAVGRELLTKLLEKMT